MTDPISMPDQPRKPLTLKTRTTGEDKQPTVPSPRKRSGKRIIRRDQLPAQSLATTKAPPPGKPAKKKKPKKAVAAKQVVTPPSDLRMAALDQQLHEAFTVWNDYQPLALGIEKSIFRFIAEHHISASKRVVQQLLQRHTTTRSYRANILQQAQRYNLDGSPAGQINQIEKDHAQRQIDVAHSV